MAPVPGFFRHYETAEVCAVADGMIQLDEPTAEQLRLWVRSSSSQQRLVRRSRIVLLLASGLSKAEIAAELKISRRTVALWERRFLEGGPDMLRRDRPGRGRPKGRSATALASIAAAMVTPPLGRARWSARALAKHVGVSHSTVLRVWRDAN
jgi:transposase